MRFLRKKIFLRLLLIVLPFIILSHNIPCPSIWNDANACNKEEEEDRIVVYTEKISPLIVKESNILICDSLSGVCGPPSGWYVKD